MKLILFITITLFTACITQAQNVRKLRIDPANAHGGNVSDFFSNVEYIPLETTKESLFGDVGQLIITDSSFVIVDYDTHAVLFFTLTGKYLRKVKTTENEYAHVEYQKNGVGVKISVYNYQKQSSVSKYYSIMGKLMPGVEKIKDATEGGRILLEDDYFIQARGCYYNIDDKPKDSVYHLLEVYKGDSLYKSFLPYNQLTNPTLCGLLGGGVNLRNSPENGTMYVATPLDFFLYKVNRDTIQKLYQFVFPLNRNLEKWIVETKDNKVIDSLRKDHRWRKESVISGISNIFMKNDILMFKIDATSYSWSSGSDAKYQYNFIYNIASGRLASLERMLPDSTNGYLPIMQGFRNAISGLTYEKEHFYSNVSSLSMFTVKEATKERNPVYTPVVDAYYKKENRKSNPVIVKLKLKGDEETKKAF